jgi:hypothetical protein
VVTLECAFLTEYVERLVLDATPHAPESHKIVCKLNITHWLLPFVGEEKVVAAINLLG